MHLRMPTFIVWSLVVLVFLLARPTHAENKAAWTSVRTPFGAGASIDEVISDGSTIFARVTTGDRTEVAIYGSSDGGKKWAQRLKQKGSQRGARVSSSIAAADKVVLFVRRGELQRSADGGKKWSTVPAGKDMMKTGVARLGNSFVAATLHEVRSSEDGGVTWSSYQEWAGTGHKGGIAGLFVARDTLYILNTVFGKDEGDEVTTVYRYVDGQWEPLKNHPNSLISGDALLANGPELLEMSVDGGKSWQSSKRAKNFKAKAIARDSINGWYLMSDSGAEYSSDNGATWSPLETPPATDCRETVVAKGNLVTMCGDSVLFASTKTLTKGLVPKTGPTQRP